VTVNRGFLFPRRGNKKPRAVNFLIESDKNQETLKCDIVNLLSRVFFEPPGALRTQRKKKKRSKSHFFGCFLAFFAPFAVKKSKKTDRLSRYNLSLL